MAAKESIITPQSLIDTLSEQQHRAFNLMSSGKNMYLGGIAGSGKSYLINVLQATTNKNVVITGTTGISAQNIGGVTIHSWAKIGICKGYSEIYNKYINPADPDPADVNKIRSWKKDRKQRFRGADILIIDEVSMLTSELLDALNRIAQLIRNSPEPMGGIQTILVGDFCQLPPIIKGANRGDSTPYCFLSSAWHEIIDEYVFLTDNFRQEGDKEYYNLLSAARRGRLPLNYNRMLQTRLISPPADSDIIPTTLYSKNINVDSENERRFNALLRAGNEQCDFKCMLVDIPSNKPRPDSFFPAEMSVIATFIDYETGEEKMERIRKYLVSTKQLHSREVFGNHCVGAQVLCSVNISQEIVNGSRGVIEGFELSEGTDLKVPVVKFRSCTEALGYRLKSVKIPDKMFKHIRGNNDSCSWHWIAYLPLRHAWALTIHKSQGLTLDLVRTSLGKYDIFTYGMGYVVLSRIKNLNSLYLDRYDPDSIYTDPEVTEFYDAVIEL